jgi:hypothetical protein
LIIIVEVIGEDLPQMALVQHDDMVDALSANRTDQTVDVRRLPWRAVRDHDLLDTDILKVPGAMQPEYASKAGSVLREI